MADEPINDITYANQLKQIQTQLAVLETSYANMTRTYYNMFYNNTPMDITLQIYDDEGALKTITVPNRAKASTSTLIHAGSPQGVMQAALGTLVLDTNTGNLYYESSPQNVDGWVQIANHNALSQEYLKKNGDGELLTNLTADSITKGKLEVAFGGTGVGDSSAIYMDGILKMVPQTTDSQGNVTRAHIAVAEVGKDYLDAANLAGMIVFFPNFNVRAGYIICDGTVCDRWNSDGTPRYENLYQAITEEETNIPEWCIVRDDEGNIDPNRFRVPDLDTFFIRCTTNYNAKEGTGRDVCSTQGCGIPNFKGTFSAEITGAMKELGGNEDNFTGAIQVVRDDQGNFKQVDGKSSAPSGSYDYLISLNPQTYNEICAEIYRDDLDEVRVKNIALVPAIKF